MTTPLAAKIAREYGTPCAVIDMDRVERNIARIQKACEAAGVANRPHIKTHKSPLLAKMQIAAGASGITCQKLGEAEVMAEAGIDDILISYNLIGDEKMARLGALQRKANMTVAADNSTVIAGLTKAAETSGRPLPVVVECDRRDRTPTGHLYLQRPHAGCGRGCDLGRLCAEHLFDGGESRRARARYSRCGLQDPDI